MAQHLLARKPETAEVPLYLTALPCRAQRELEEAEAAVAEVEAQVAKVVAALEDPALYTRPDGAASAHELGAQLETLKRELEAGLERWTQATEHVQMRVPRGGSV